MFKRIKRWFQRPPNPAGHIYYVRLLTSEGVFYKVGFTVKDSVRERFAYGGYGDEHLIARELLFTFRKDAWDVEQTLLDHFNKHRAFGKFSSDPEKPLFRRGQSELFSFDVLGLDKDLYKLTEEEMASVKEDLDTVQGGCLFLLIGIILIPFTLGFSLFFIIGGLSGFFGLQKSTVDVNKGRPKHPPKIQSLIDELTRGTTG